MYAERYGTDWETLDHDEVVERAFALGVDAAFGSPNEEEYDRLVAELDAYDRSLVELAYREGRSEALDLRREGDGEAAVWSELVEEELTDVGDQPGPGNAGVPGLVDRLEALDRPTVTDLPEFLRGG